MTTQNPAPVIPPITSPDALDVMWSGHLEALRNAADAHNRAEWAAGEADKKRHGLAAARQDIERAQQALRQLQENAANLEAEAIRFEVAAEDSRSAEQTCRTTADELGRTVEYHVAQGRGAVQHPGERAAQQTRPEPVGDTGAFPAAVEAGKP